MYAHRLDFSIIGRPSPSISRDWCLERVSRGPTKVPHVPTRCNFIAFCANMQHMTRRCTGIGLRELLDHSNPFNTGSRPGAPKGWSRSDVDLQCCIGLVVLCFLMPSALEMAALRAWAPCCTHSHARSIKLLHLAKISSIYRRYIVDISTISSRSEGLRNRR